MYETAVKAVCLACFRRGVGRNIAWRDVPGSNFERPGSGEAESANLRKSRTHLICKNGGVDVRAIDYALYISLMRDIIQMHSILSFVETLYCVAWQYPSQLEKLLGKRATAMDCPCCSQIRYGQWYTINSFIVRREQWLIIQFFCPSPFRLWILFEALIEARVANSKFTTTLCMQFNLTILISESRFRGFITSWPELI